MNRHNNFLMTAIDVSLGLCNLWIYPPYTVASIKPQTNPMNYSASAANFDELSFQVLKHAFDVHTALGPGLLESSYKECLFYELVQNGFFVEKEKALPLVYKAVKLDIGYRIDLLVEHKLIIEIKSVDTLTDIHTAQVLTYLKLSRCRRALLINFNVIHLKSGIHRLVL